MFIQFLKFLIRRITAVKYGYRIPDKCKLFICAILASVPATFRENFSALDVAIERVIGLCLRKALALIDSIKFYLADYDSLITVSKEYEAPIRRYFNLKAGVFVDVGAHIGKYAVGVAKELRQGLVIAIEPSPKVYAVLVRNIDINGLNNIIAIDKAAYNKSARLRLYKSSALSMYSIKNYQEMGFIEVEVETLDNILEKLDIKGVKLVKIAVEGAEIEVLEGFRNGIIRDKPQMIIECREENQEKLMNLMEEFRYQVNPIMEVPNYFYCKYVNYHDSHADIQ